jgi:hypothetical protein
MVVDGGDRAAACKVIDHDALLVNARTLEDATFLFAVGISRVTGTCEEFVSGQSLRRRLPTAMELKFSWLGRAR